MTRSFNVTPKTTEQNLIARNDKSVAYVTNNKRLFDILLLLKLTTDRHEASRGLFATAEPVVKIDVLAVKVVIVGLSGSGVLVNASFCHHMKD